MWRPGVDVPITTYRSRHANIRFRPRNAATVVAKKRAMSSDRYCRLSLVFTRACPSTLTLQLETLDQCNGFAGSACSEVISIRSSIRTAFHRTLRESRKYVTPGSTHVAVIGTDNITPTTPRTRCLTITRARSRRVLFCTRPKFIVPTIRLRFIVLTNMHVFRAPLFDIGLFGRSIPLPPSVGKRGMISRAAGRRPFNVSDSQNIKGSFQRGRFRCPLITINNAIRAVRRAHKTTRPFSIARPSSRRFRFSAVGRSLYSRCISDAHLLPLSTVDTPVLRTGNSYIVWHNRKHSHREDQG